MLFQWIKRKALRRKQARELYQAALIQSRDPAFYDTFGVADTMDGRFDLLCLHIILLIERVNQFGAEGRRLGQAVFDAMFKRMDLDLREMGIGDLGVPKHMQKMMKAFNGRRQAYDAALQSGNAAMLELAIARNVYRIEGEAVPSGVDAIANYVQRTQAQLRAATADDVKAARVSFPVVSAPVRKVAHG